MNREMHGYLKSVQISKGLGPTEQTSAAAITYYIGLELSPHRLKKQALGPNQIGVSSLLENIDFPISALHSNVFGVVLKGEERLRPFQTAVDVLLRIGRKVRFGQFKTIL